MAKEFTRAQRVEQEIQKKIAIILQRELQNPHVGLVTVSSVWVSKDLAYAKIFVTFLDKSEMEEIKVSLEALQSATGFIRTLLGKAMKLRVVPSLSFEYDNSLVEGMRMSNLVTEVINQDIKRCSNTGSLKGDS